MNVNWELFAACVLALLAGPYMVMKGKSLYKEYREYCAERDRIEQEIRDEERAEREANAPKPPIGNWATHRIVLVKNHVWYHILPDVIYKGTEADAVFVNGQYIAWIDQNRTKGYFTFSDDEVLVLEHLR